MSYQEVLRLDDALRRISELERKLGEVEEFISLQNVVTIGDEHEKGQHTEQKAGADVSGRVQEVQQKRLLSKAAA